jgi:hypothetical protein
MDVKKGVAGFRSPTSEGWFLGWGAASNLQGKIWFFNISLDMFYRSMYFKLDHGT